MMERKTLISIALGLLLVVVLWQGGLYRNSYITHPATHGSTMGTTYSIRISGKVKKDKLNELKQRIDEKLKEVNRQMSTWDMNSEISRFNHSHSTEPFPVSAELASVVRRALEYSRSTQGAFDPTLQPLLNLWGFGSEGITVAIPSESDIAAVKKTTGWDKVEVISATALRKKEAGVSLALGAIAKGYGVDVIAGLLKDEGYRDWLVEIGGEMALMGLNPEGVPWKVGIQYPSLSPGNRYQGILHLTEGAVATSGDYRNYIVDHGVIYSHILDPRTGRAVLSDTASVSVYAANCTDADAVATALFVMGPKEGLAWAEKTPGIEVMFLSRMSDGSIFETFSSGFIAATGYTSSIDERRE